MSREDAFRIVAWGKRKQMHAADFLGSHVGPSPSSSVLLLFQQKVEFLVLPGSCIPNIWVLPSRSYKSLENPHFLFIVITRNNLHKMFLSEQHYSLGKQLCVSFANSWLACFFMIVCFCFSFSERVKFINNQWRSQPVGLQARAFKLF